ncbi:MAG: pyridoxal phosphate-dependent aminotransferase [Acidobacteria bacterium]|nr:pyridoxal phosphate-dependent aminotransferase [Acidobacteriota bacterium]
MFSSRLPARLRPSVLSQAVSRARTAGTVRLDLTETNPTVVGLDYPPAAVEALAARAALTYRPAALGTDDARRAVAGAYAAKAPDPARIMLTASTSEAYSFLFKLLCDPGDEVLVPHPSYPLFDLLTALDGVRQAPYHLDESGGWCLDRASIEEGVSPSTRALLVVSPNNPTGSMLRSGDRDWLVAFARDRGLVLISDEVFADYPLAPRADVTTLLGEDRVLTFTLGGLSKSAGLPQMKLAWTVVSGPDALVASALERLEIIADSYLSVSTPVQLAAPALIAAGLHVRESIRGRVQQNLQTLRRIVRHAPALTLHEPDGGWSVVLRVPAILSEEQWVLHLLEEHGVLAHPGYFFDIETGVHLVISLLPLPDVFETGVSHIAAMASGTHA